MGGRRTFLRPAGERPRGRAAGDAPPTGSGGGGLPPHPALGRGNASPKCAEKTRVRAGSGRPVPQTDTGGWVEQTKVRERNHVKELGKIVP